MAIKNSGHVTRFHTDSCTWNIWERTRTATRKRLVKGSEGELKSIITWRIKMTREQVLFHRDILQHPNVWKLGEPQGCLHIMVKKETNAFTRIQALFILHVTIFTESY